MDCIPLPVFLAPESPCSPTEVITAEMVPTKPELPERKLPPLASVPAAAILSVAPTPRPTPVGADRDRLFVIGAGLSRTGTETMTAAMEILMGQRAYHGGTAIVVGGIVKEGALWKRPERIPDFERIFDARDDGVVYSSTFDTPGNNFVTELMERYPNYRVLLTKRRSAEEWAESVMKTVVPMSNQLRFLDRVSCGKVKPIRNAMEFVDEYSLGKPLGFTSADATHEKLVQIYNMHLETVRKLVPADRLIEFNAGDGWEPLCKALNLPIPSVPFPRKNERVGFKWRTGVGSLKTFSKNHWPQVLCLVVALLFFWYMMMMQLVRMTSAPSYD